MGNLCIPDTAVDSLELTLSPPSKHRPQLLKKQSSVPEDVPLIEGGPFDDEAKPRQKSQEDGLVRLMSTFRVPDMSILWGMAGSEYSKLNKHEFREVVVPPSSGRLTVIERMQTEGVVPEQVFIIAITKSQFKGFRSFRLPVRQKRTLSLK